MLITVRHHPGAGQLLIRATKSGSRGGARGNLRSETGVWQTSSMKTSPNYPQCPEDRKVQKLVDRIDKKLQEKGTTQNSLQAASPKQCPSAA